MRIVKIDKKEWEKGLENLSASFSFISPVKNNSFYEFKENGQPDFSFKNSRLSPKSYVFPQSEIMFCYTTDKTKPDCNIIKEIQKDYSPKALIGIRPCDAASFLIVKRNFDTPECKDTFWLKSYEACLFIGLACNAPKSSCFCTSAGSGPFDESGLDILLIDLSEYFFVKIISEKGEAAAKIAGWNEEAEDNSLDLINNAKNEAEAKIKSFISTDKIADKNLLDLYNAPFWEKETFACLNCGTCTFVCPTCWCFDIQDENKGQQGIRTRNWDSCMFPLFTLHGSGHNPRTKKYERVKQRFMHKLKYYQDKYKSGIQCVGCGRCIDSCPVNIDIRHIAELMDKYNPA